VTFHLSHLQYSGDESDDVEQMKRGIIIGPWQLPDTLGKVWVFVCLFCFFEKQEKKKKDEKNLEKLALLVEEYGLDPEKVFPPNVKHLLSMIHRLLTIDAHDPVFILRPRISSPESDNDSVCKCGDILFASPDPDDFARAIDRLSERTDWTWRDTSDFLNDFAEDHGFEFCSNKEFEFCLACKTLLVRRNFCGGCINACYCSRKCAEAHWMTHRAKCEPWSWLSEMEQVMLCCNTFVC
jgi:hypothetical protein